MVAKTTSGKSGKGLSGLSIQFWRATVASVEWSDVTHGSRQADRTRLLDLAGSIPGGNGWPTRPNACITAQMAAAIYDLPVLLGPTNIVSGFYFYRALNQGAEIFGSDL